MKASIVNVLFYPVVGLTYISNGMQLIIIGWLAMDVLVLSPLWVAVFMAAMLIPQVALLPFTGRYADIYAPEKLARMGCFGLTLSHLALAAVQFYGLITPPVLAIYSIALGACMALFLPAKDKASVLLLPHRLQKTLALVGAYQYFGLMLGALVAGLGMHLGLIPLLLLQAALVFVSAAYWLKLRTPLVSEGMLETIPIGDVLRQTPALQQLMMLCAFCGFMHMGFALALFPVLGVKHWGFDAQSYALMQALFSAGGIAVYLANAYRKPHQYPGQALLFCLLYTAAIAYGIARGPSVTGSYCLIFLWGVVAGYSASMSRIVLHSLVGDHRRGQVAALYQTVLLTAAPIGSLVCGLVLQVASVMAVLWLIGIASCLVFALFLTSRQMWSVRQQY